MPLIRIDALAGRDEQTVKALLDAVHRAVLTAFQVPERDRYQIYQEHTENNFVVQDTGLGIVRSKKRIVVTVVTRPRSQASKQIFYRELCREAQAACDIGAEDVVVSLIENSDSDWSFGNGEAQFLTGDL